MQTETQNKRARWQMIVERVRKAECLCASCVPEATDYLRELSDFVVELDTEARALREELDRLRKVACRCATLGQHSAESEFEEVRRMVGAAVTSQVFDSDWTPPSPKEG